MADDHPAEDELDYWHRVFGGAIVTGFADSNEEPIPLTSTERAAARKQRREALERKKPLGFAEWPDQEGTT